ncbi:MAG TPA: hypothetical protein VKB26_15050 [Candidatus Acidoferrales bacterium]|nr:hypothetical protein [Candidatus Acidoferrales bacterium]
MRKILVSAGLVLAIALALTVSAFQSKLASADDQGNFQFVPDTLVLSRSVYAGNSGTVTVNQVLPPGCIPITITLPVIGGGTTTVTVPANSSSGCTNAIADGTYPTVFNNSNFNGNAVDGSFGLTSPIFLDNITTDGRLLGTLSVPSDQIDTSFSSKSELALNLSTDGRSITFMGYRGGTGFVTSPNQLDVSNSNTPGVVDPSNPVVSQYFRSVAEVDAHGHLQITEGNAYSGNNGRAAIKANGMYYTTGNDNNGGLSKTQLTDTQDGLNLINATGVELFTLGQTNPATTNEIGDFEVTQVGFTKADKPGKDNNFRGLTIFNNTLYVTKGSGGNGINTVYQVGDAGTLPTLANAPGGNLRSVPITILPGFPMTEANGNGADGSMNNPVAFPFGIWFANANTLYVCDEGDGNLVSPPVNGNVADASAQATAGLQKWSKGMDGTWTMDYVLQDGLDIGVPYSVANLSTSLDPATDGCRNLTGRVNQDGTVTIYAVTSTVSASGDQGADPNKLVKITDVLSASTLPNPMERFVTIRAAGFGEVLRGVAFAPQDQGAQGNQDSQH